MQGLNITPVLHCLAPAIIWTGTNKEQQEQSTTTTHQSATGSNKEKSL
jgi:hypothetical protein